jgi:uncharacterized YccA/Bax inhibitor family protein
MLRFLGTMIVYAVFLVGSVWTFVHFRPTGVLAWLLAILPALAIIGQMAAFALYLAEEKDEFLRNVQIQAMLWGIGGTLAITTTWGFLESFVQLRHFDLILVYPLYCGVTGLCWGLVKTRYE